MYSRSTIFLLLIWLISLTGMTVSMAQLPDFNVQLLNESNGIQSGNITRLITDKQGFLWMLSPRNLQRFDGQNVKKIETDGEDLLDIASDSSGTIWLTTGKGVERYVNDSQGFEKLQIESPGVQPLNKLHKVHVTPDNRIWINARYGLYRYDALTHKFKYHPIPGLKKGIEFYRRIFSIKNYRLYLGDVNTLFQYDVQRNTSVIIPFEGVRNVVPFSDNISWVTNTLLQTFEVDFRTKTIKAVRGFVRADILSITPLTDHTYLVNTTQGCYKYNEFSKQFFKITFFHLGKELPNDENYADYLDEAGTLWILSQEGIMFFKPLEHNIGWLRGYSAEGKKWNNNVRSIAEDSKGNIWLGTDHGLTKLSLKNGNVKTYHANVNVANAFRHPWVRNLVFDGKNLIVSAGVGEPVIFNPETETFRHLTFPDGKEGVYLRKKLERDLIARVFRMNDGDFLVLGEGSCYVLEKGSYRISERIFEGTAYNIQTAEQERNGNFWMGSYNGLLYVDKNFKTLLGDDHFAPNSLVSSLLIRNDSTVWCGSVGLFEVIRTRGKLLRKRLFPQFRNQRITLLYQDKNKKTWIGADDGLYRFDEASKKLEWFDVWDNIQNKQLNVNSLFTASDGNLYLGGPNGLNYFKPEKIEPREEKLNVIISGFSVNQDDSSYMLKPAPPQLDWKQNSVEIEFVTTYFRNPRKLIYRYRLKGLDNGWQTNGRNNTVRFSSLAPNDYQFTVAASLDGIKWFETAHPFAFSISPPFWQRAWFIALCIVLASGLGFFILRKRIAIIKKQTDLRERFFEVEMKALRAQMNPHFIFNCLNSINRYIVKSDNATASLYLTRFSKLIRLILDNSNSKNVLLSNELEALKLYIEMEGIRFDNKFDYQIILDENVSPDSIEVPSLIIQPYVENAIWHGLLHKETAGTLRVRVSMLGEGMLRCIIEDNGIGRAKAMEYRSKSAMGKKSLGMKLTEDRIAILNQYAKTNASVEIQDLEGDDRTAAGTRVVIKIPI